MRHSFQKNINLFYKVNLKCHTLCKCLTIPGTLDNILAYLTIQNDVMVIKFNIITLVFDLYIKNLPKPYILHQSGIMRLDLNN